METNFELLDEIYITLEEQIDRIFDVLESEDTSKKILVKEIQDVFTNAIQRYIDVLTSEFSSENKCRISIWRVSKDNDSKLNIVARSSSFLRSSTLELDVNNSIAGRALRKKIKQFSKKLDSDPDWTKYFQESHYKAISAFPLIDEKVVTIDYKNVPTNVEDRLSELIVDGISNILHRISHVEIFISILEEEI